MNRGAPKNSSGQPREAATIINHRATSHYARNSAERRLSLDRRSPATGDRPVIRRRSVSVNLRQQPNRRATAGTLGSNPFISPATFHLRSLPATAPAIICCVKRGAGRGTPMTVTVHGGHIIRRPESGRIINSRAVAALRYRRSLTSDAERREILSCGEHGGEPALDCQSAASPARRGRNWIPHAPIARRMRSAT